MIYAAQVNEIVSLEEYSSHSCFAIKKPGAEGNGIHGDNIYYKDNKGKWQQRPNPHHDDSFTETDTQGENVLIAKDFWYFGNKAPKISSALQSLIGNARLKCLRDERVIKDFITWINTFPKGVNGAPSDAGKCGVPCGNTLGTSGC